MAANLACSAKLGSIVGITDIRAVRLTVGRVKGTDGVARRLGVVGLLVYT